MPVRKPLMTLRTKRRLEAELAETKNNILKAGLAIGEAGGTDDWHENFALEEAFRNYEMIKRNEIALSQSLVDIEIINPRQETNEVGIGNTVEVKYEGSEKVEIFTVLGDYDPLSDPSWISFSSPLGANLIGKTEGCVVEFDVKENNFKVEILKIKPGDF